MDTRSTDELTIPESVLESRQGISLAKRAAVWDTSGGRCHYCGVTLNPFRTFTIDHVIPKSRGGTNAIENLVAACPDCNCRKGDQLAFSPHAVDGGIPDDPPYVPAE